MLANNQLTNLPDLDPLGALPKLKSLTLTGNPVSKRPYYRAYLINRIPSLRVIDFQRITEKVWGGAWVGSSAAACPWWL